MFSVVENKNPSLETRLEYIPDVAFEIYDRCFSGAEVDPYFFPENFSKLLIDLNYQVGWSYDCHSFASGFLKISGVDNIPHLQASDEDWPIIINPKGCSEGSFDSSAFNLISALMMDNPQEAKRKSQFNSYLINNAKIREVIHENDAENFSVENNTLNATQIFLEYSKSRLGMIVSHTRTGIETIEKVDRHSFIVLGPNNDQTDLFILEREKISLGFNGLRVKKLSNIIDYYKRFHSTKDEIVFLAEDIPTVLKNLF